MMILVMYGNGRTAMVPEKQLQTLIESGSIRKFRRNGEWAMLGEAMTRRREPEDYTGVDRRIGYTRH